MKGDDAYAHKCQNLEERSSKLSAYEIIQTIIGINLLIVTIVGVCISAFIKITILNCNKPPKFIQILRAITILQNCTLHYFKNFKFKKAL